MSIPERIIKYLKDQREDSVVSAKDFSDWSANRKTINKALQRLAELNKIERVSRGKYRMNEGATREGNHRPLDRLIGYF